MSEQELTAKRLLRAGFQRAGCWELRSEQQLTHPIDLPTRTGVYAFAVDGIVQYVGLASTSIRQRMGFYSKPGAGQRTNVRLNEIIRGHIAEGSVVEILIAHPADFEWEGLKVSGAEGLEAGLIREFDLPWNIRGSSRSAKLVRRKVPRPRSVSDRILSIVRHRPGLTELEIARAMYGKDATQQQVNRYCRELDELGLIERSGVGGPGDPYVYFPSTRPPRALTRVLMQQALKDID